MPRRKRKTAAGSTPEIEASIETASSEAVETQEQGWQVVGAAVRGVSHERLDLPCQDACGYARLPNGTLVIAVADGAGSASCSELGAQAAVAETLRLLEEALDDQLPQDMGGWEDVFHAAAYSARLSVLSLAESADDLPRNYASTLTMVAVRPDILAVGQIGDGAVVALGEDGRLFAATRLQRGEYANETHFLIQEDALDHLVIDVFAQSVSALAVMSDGLIRLALKLPGQDPHAPFFEPLFRFLHAVGDEDAAADQLAGFLASERVNARTDDDKALVLAARIDRTAA